MRQVLLAIPLMFGLAHSALAQDAAAVAAAAAASAASAPADAPPTETLAEANEKNAEAVKALGPLGDICLFAGTPPAEAPYTVLKRVKYGKQTYGPVREILPELARRAQNLGGDAIIEYAGSQRFGFFPWRLVRPVVRGTAIKWTGGKAPGCTAIGGTTVREVIISDRPPAS